MQIHGELGQGQYETDQNQNPQKNGSEVHRPQYSYSYHFRLMFKPQPKSKSSENQKHAHPAHSFLNVVVGLVAEASSNPEPASKNQRAVSRICSPNILVEIPNALVFQIAGLHPLEPRCPLLFIGGHAIPWRIALSAVPSQTQTEFHAAEALLHPLAMHHFGLGLFLFFQFFSFFLFLHILSNPWPILVDSFSPSNMI